MDVIESIYSGVSVGLILIFIQAYYSHEKRIRNIIVKCQIAEKSLNNNQYQEALLLYEEVLQSVHKTIDARYYSMIQQDIGRCELGIFKINYDEKFLKKAKDAIDESYTVAIKRKYADLLFPMIPTIGEIYYFKAYYRDPIMNIKEALRIFNAFNGMKAVNDLPILHGNITSTMGSLYIRLSEFENEKINLNIGIDLYQRALNLVNKSLYPIDFIRIQLNLAESFRVKAIVEQNPQFLEDSENLSKDIDYSIDATKNLLEFTLFEMNKGNLLHTKGKLLMNPKFLRDALLKYENVLSILYNSENRLLIGIIHYNIGLVHTDLIKHGREIKYLSSLNDHIKKSLLIFNINDFPLYYGKINNAHGNAYLEVYRITKKDVDLEMALKAFEKASSVFNFSSLLNPSIITHFNIVKAVSIRSVENPSNLHLQKKLDIYSKILTEIHVKENPLEYVISHHNIGSAYLMSFYSSKNMIELNHAIMHFTNALSGEEIYKSPKLFRQIRRELGNAYGQKAEMTNTTEDLKTSINYLRESLIDEENSKQEYSFGVVNKSIGDRYYSLFKIDSSLKYLEHSERYYHAAFELKQWEAEPELQGEIANSLGVVKIILFEYTKDPNLLQEAIQLFTRAIDSLPQERYQSHHQMILSNIKLARKKLLSESRNNN